MEEVLGESYYQDDFLSRTLNESLYDKNALDLSFTDNNNCTRPPKSCTNGSTLLSIQNDNESPNLDFLKLGSPDLEQMFMNIEDESDFSDNLVNSSSRSPTSTAAFNLEDDLLNSENCFTDTLQQLHDKQMQTPLDSIDLLDIPIKIEKEEQEDQKNDINCISSDTQRTQQHQHQQQHHHQQKQQPRYRQRKQSSVKLNPSKNTQSNLSNKSSNKYIGSYNKRSRDHHQQQTLLSNHIVHPQNNRTIQQQQHNSLSGQLLTINNQLSLLGAQQAQHQSHHQQQQNHELALLAQSIANYQHNEQDSIITNSAMAPHTINQMPAQIQQKILEQQLIHQQVNTSTGYDQNNTQASNIQRLNEINSAGIDEQTLKMFVENPHLAPINLEIQELIKRERKKLRNRIASSKCRKRKLEREGRLEDKVRNLKEKNIELNAVANALKQQICDLKQRVMDHVSEGCQVVLPTC